MKVTLKTNIRYNGLEYSSADQLPAEVREAYDRALAGKGGRLPDSNGLVATELIVNGQPFASPDEIPADDKKLYDDVMQLLRDQQHAKVIAPSAPPSDTGWLTKRQVQLIAIVAALLLWLALFLAGR